MKKVDEQKKITNEDVMKNQTDILDQIFSGRKDVNEENDRKEIVKEWLNPENIEVKTELNQNQIYAVTVLQSLAEHYFIIPLQNLIKNFTKFMLSKNRGTSKELVEILKGGVSTESDPLMKVRKFFE